MHLSQCLCIHALEHVTIINKQQQQQQQQQQQPERFPTAIFSGNRLCEERLPCSFASYIIPTILCYDFYSTYFLDYFYSTFPSLAWHSYTGLACV